MKGEKCRIRSNVRYFVDNTNTGFIVRFSEFWIILKLCHFLKVGI